MKKIMLIFALLCSVTFAKNDDDLDLKLDKEVSFRDGFGTISAYPQNITDDLKNKLKFMGEYNLDKDNNVTIKFKRISYDGRVYDLTEPFEKKLRIKSPQTAKFNNGAKIKVTGGNREEILQIVNRQNVETKQTAQANKNNKTQNQLQRDGRSGSDLSSSLLSGARNSTTPYYTPYYASETTSSGTSDYSSATTNNDGSCRAPVIVDGVVNVYATSVSGGSCKLFTAPESTIYFKYGEATCKNKIDYDSKTISVGREGFVALEDGKEYKVKSCEYLPTQDLKSDLSTCMAIPNYKDKTATIQNQFYFMLENERHNVGGCTPTEEKVELEEDLNKCGYRHDFVRKVSIKQRQFFYMQGNTRQDVGECVDKDEEGFIFPHYEDNTTCSYEVQDDRVFYQSRIAFTDLTGGRSYATECRVVSAGGLEIHEELSGYQYNDQAKQAQRKVNQYFYIPDTNVKKYVKKDVLTDKTYPYEETLCKWENDDENKISTRYSKIFFKDTDENKEVVISECSNTINVGLVAYAYLGEERQVEEVLTGKTLIPQKQDNGNVSYKIYGTSDYLINTPNQTNNINEVFTGIGSADVLAKYNNEQREGIETKETEYTTSVSSCEMGQNPTGKLCYKTEKRVDVKTKAGYGTNQVIEKSLVKETYRRGDGTKYYPETKTEWRAK